MWQGFAMAGNERLSGCAYVVEPLMADTSLRAINFWTCEPGDLPAFTTVQEAIEQVFQCRRNSRPGSTYMQAMALVEPLLAVEKYPGRTPEQEEFRQRMELAN